MPVTLLGEVLEWSIDRPAWQRDALRRLFTTGQITVDDLEELVAICKAARGLTEVTTVRPLTEKDLAVKGESPAPVTLVSVTHNHGVNALAPEQTITFGTNLTVVYGQNTAGKSGYTRILKRACRSRFTEDILGNVLSGDAPLKPQATIVYRQGTDEDGFVWGPDAPASPSLAAVSVFDAHCVPVYLRDKTDVAFRPFGLDIFDRLSAVCGEVRTRLDREHALLNASTPRLPVLPEGPAAQVLIARLTSLTNVEGLRKAATLSQIERRRLKELKDQQRDLQAADPKQRARELELQAGRIEQLRDHVIGLLNALDEGALVGLISTADSLRVARAALATLRRTVLTPDLLPKTGEETWRAMWDAAEGFSMAAVPGTSFPVLTEGAVCPFCQQKIEATAATRLKHFAEYVSSTAQADVRRAETAHAGALAAVSRVVVNRPDIELVASELAAEDTDLESRLQKVLRKASRIKEEVGKAAESGAFPRDGLKLGIEAEIGSVANTLRERAESLRKQGGVLDAQAAKELRELEARVTLAEHLKDVVDEVERQKRLAAYKQCIDDTQTQPITRKSTELTKRLITDQLRGTFKDELSKLDFTHLAVELQPAGGSRGALFHRLAFTNAPNVVVAEVLSDSESRTLSLAAFLTELSTANRKSAIIFDDPVSSLDHIWRERIARRLVNEAKDRQVIVFTHDILFLRFLLDETDKQEMACHHQYVRREGQAGVSSPELPWLAMRIKDRTGALNKRWQAADKVFRTAGREAYDREAREVYGLLREAWEQATSETLLNDVVERYRPSIETRKVRLLHDITEADCRAVDDAMTECSRWIRGHDQAAADATPVPEPAELKRRIDDLDAWVKAIEKRRRK